MIAFVSVCLCSISGVGILICFWRMFFIGSFLASILVFIASFVFMWAILLRGVRVLAFVTLLMTRLRLLLF